MNVAKNIPFLFTPIPNFFLQQEYFHDHETVLLALWMFKRTDYREHSATVGTKTIKLESGEFIFGRKSCAEATGLSEQVIRTRLNHMINRQWLKKITSKSTNKFTVYKWVWSSFPQTLNHQKNRKKPNFQPEKNHNQEVENKRAAFIREKIHKRSLSNDNA